jgi:hypothetical protein
MEVVECGEDGSALGRSLKPIPSEHIAIEKRPFAVITTRRIR